MQAEANDYVEKEFGAFYRSYPAEGGDALAYQRDGFLWNAAEKAGLSVKDFGEYNRYITGTRHTAATGKNGTKTRRSSKESRAGRCRSRPREYKTTSDIPSLNEISDPAYPRFDLEIPDQYRYDIWKAEFEHEESAHAVPNLTLIWLPDDHTGGAPDPVAQVADNDLAFGRIVETISHSKVWKDSAIFGVEDDTQNGVDHVDGHRGPAFVISPYAKGGVQDEYETQLNMVRTVEQILGIQPMNQEDYAAEPMYGAFTETPNFEPYTAAAQRNPADARRRRLRRDGGGEDGWAVRGRGAGLDAGRLRSLDELEAASVLPWPGRHTGLGQAGAAQPVRLVLRARLEGGVPGRPEDLPARRSARQEPTGRVPRRLIKQAPRPSSLGRGA